MSRIHPLSILVFLTGIVLAIVGIVLAIVFGVQHSIQQSCPVQNNCQAELFSLRTGLQGVTWTPNLGVVGSPEFNKQQALAQNQLQSVLQGSLTSAPSNKAARFDVNTDPTGNNVIVSVTKFALATDGVTVIAFASGAVAGSQTGLTDLPTNYTTTFQQSLDQDDKIAKGGAVVSDDSTSMCESVEKQLPALVTSPTSKPTQTATTSTCAPPTSCPNCPVCPTQSACPKPTVCPTETIQTTKEAVTCPACPTQEPSTCPVCPTETIETTRQPATCPACPTLPTPTHSPNTTCPACPATTVCPTAPFTTTITPVTCPVCTTQTACPETIICPTESIKTTKTPSTCPACPTQKPTTCPVCAQPTACPTSPLLTTGKPVTCPVCPEPVNCPTTLPITTPKYTTTTEAATTSSSCSGIFVGDIALLFEETTSAIDTGLEKELQDFMSNNLIFAAGLPYIFDGNTTRVQLFPYGETESYSPQINFDFAKGPTSKKQMNAEFETVNSQNGLFMVDSAVINDGLLAVAGASKDITRNRAIVIVADNDLFVNAAANTAASLRHSGWTIFVVSFNEIGEFSELTSSDNIYYRNKIQDEQKISQHIAQTLVQISNPGCVFTMPPSTPSPTTKKPVCREIYEGDIAVVFEETLDQVDGVDDTMHSFIEKSLIFGKGLPYDFNKKDTRLQLYPYGDTSYYDLNLYYQYGPQTKADMNTIFGKVNYYCNEYGINDAKIRDGLESVLASPDHGTRFGALILVAYSDQYVKEAVNSANALKKAGWDLFVVSFNKESNFSSLTTSDNIYIRSSLPNNDADISNSIAQKIVAQSNNGCAVPTGPTSTVTAKPTPTPKPSTAKPTNCPSQSFYYGDIAIVFEQTMSVINDIPYAIHNFISFRLLAYANNPYIIDGNTTRILLAPYGETVNYRTNDSYAYGPSSLEEIANMLVPMDGRTEENQYDEPDMKEGLSFVRTAKDHNERVGSIIIVGLRDLDVQTAKITSKTLQRAGYNVFTVTFGDDSDLSPLASNKDFAFYRYIESDELNIAETIGKIILSTSPCDPNPPATVVPSTVLPPEEYFFGNIAVVFEQTHFNMEAAREAAIHDFITYRLFYYPGNPYAMPTLTKTLLIPYGNTTKYKPYKHYKDTVISMENIADELEYFDEIDAYNFFNVPNMEDGLDYILKNIASPGGPLIAIVIGYSDKFVQSSIKSSNALKAEGYQVFTVSFNESAVFDSLATISDYVFTRNNEADEMGIAEKIGNQLLRGPPSASPTTSQPPTTKTTSTNCSFYGNLAILFEETTNLIDSQTQESTLHDYITNSLLGYSGNPYIIDGKISRIMLVPYGNTTQYGEATESWANGPKNLSAVTKTLQEIFLTTQMFELNNPNIQDGLQYVLDSRNGDMRQSAVVLIGYSDQYISSSESTAQLLKEAGFHVFTISFSVRANYKLLASDVDSNFMIATKSQEDGISQTIGNWLMSQPQQQCTTTTTKPAVKTSLAPTTAHPNCPGQDIYYGDIAIIFEQTAQVLNFDEYSIKNFIVFKLLSYLNNPYIIDGQTTRILLVPYGETDSFNLNNTYAGGPNSLESLNNMFLPFDETTLEYDITDENMKPALQFVRNALDHKGRAGTVIVIGLGDSFVISSQSASKTLQRAGYNVMTVSFSPTGNFSALASDPNLVYIRDTVDDELPIAKQIGDFLKSSSPCDPIPPTTALPTTAVIPKTIYTGNIAVVLEESWLNIRYGKEQPLHDFIIYRLFNFPGNPYSFPDSTRAIFIPYGSTEYYNLPTSYKYGSIHDQEDISDELENLDIVADQYLLSSTSIIDGLNYLIDHVTLDDGMPQTVILVGITAESVKNATGAATTLRNKGYNIITVSFNENEKFDALASGKEYVFTRKSEKDEVKIAEDIANLLVNAPTPKPSVSIQPETTTSSQCPGQDTYYGDVAVVFEETEQALNSLGNSIRDFIVFKLFGYINSPYIVDGQTSRILLVPYGDTQSYILNNSYTAGPTSLESLNNMFLNIDETAVHNDFNTPNMKTGLQFVKNTQGHNGRVGAVIIVGLLDDYVLSSQSASKTLQRAGYNVMTVSFSPTGNFSSLASDPSLSYIRDTVDDELPMAKQIGDFLKSTSPCDPVPPTTVPSTTVVSPTNKYSGNIAVVFEETFRDILHNVDSSMHDFIIYRLFNFAGNPYSFPYTTRALMIPYGMTSYYNLPFSYSDSISDQEEISDQLENFDIIANSLLLNSVDISDGLNYVIKQVSMDKYMQHTVILIGMSDQFVKNASTAATTLRQKGYNIITVAFNESAKFDTLASGPEYVFTRSSEKDEVKIAEGISNLLINPPPTNPTSPRVSVSPQPSATTSSQCPGQNLYYGDVAVVYEETWAVTRFEAGYTIRDFIGYRLFNYVNSPYVIDGITSRILLAPYAYTDAYPLSESYAKGPESLELLNNQLTRIDEFFQVQNYNTPNMKTGLKFVSNAQDHGGRVGSVIIIGLSDSFVKSSLSASKSLQRAGYNVLTVSFSNTSDFSSLSSANDLNFQRNFVQDEVQIAQNIGDFLKSTAPCDPTSITTVVPTTNISPTTKYTGNIAVLFEQTYSDPQKDVTQNERELAIHDFIIYRLFNYPGNPYQLAGTTKAVLIPYGSTEYYTLAKSYKYASVRDQDEISDELEDINQEAMFYSLESTDMSAGFYYIRDSITGDKNMPETVILIGNSDKFVTNSLVAAQTLREVDNYNIITVSFNASSNFAALASGRDYVFTRNSEQDEINIARSIADILMNPPSLAPTTSKPVTSPVTPSKCADQKFYYGDLAIVFEETMDIMGFESGRSIHDYISFSLLSYPGNPYIIDGNTSRILLVPYGSTFDFKLSNSYANGPKSMEDLNNRFEPMDVITQLDNLYDANMKEGLQFVKSARDHKDRAGNVIIIGKSARFVPTSVAASKSLQKAGYNVFTISFDKNANLAPLASSLQYVYTRSSPNEEMTISELIGMIIATTTKCDPVAQPTGPTTTVAQVYNPYRGNIAVMFEQSRLDISDGKETIIHDFLTYRLLTYPGNPYDLGSKTKALLMPYGSTTSYGPSNSYTYSVTGIEDIADELENIDSLCNELSIDSFDMSTAFEVVENIKQGDHVPYTAIIIGYSDRFVKRSIKQSEKLQSQGYRVFTISFNASTPLDALATSADYAFIRNNEQDENVIANTIANMLMNPNTLAPPTATAAPVCEDISTTCASVKSRCHQPAFEKTLEQTCRLTCGYCTPDTTVNTVASSPTTSASLGTTILPKATSTVTKTGASTPSEDLTTTPKCFEPDIYFGDIAILFDQTFKAYGSGVEKDIHNFINFHLLTYANNIPYRIDGNTTRILLVPYGETEEFSVTQSYAKGPKSMEQIGNLLEKFDQYTLETQSGQPDVKSGLQFVKNALDHGNRLGSIIILGADDSYVNTAYATSKNLQRSGYNVFTVSFIANDDFSSLASKKEYAYKWSLEKDDDTIAANIGQQILATSPCNPDAPVKVPSTTPVIPIVAYKGNIAVVFEQTHNDIVNQEALAFHNFITYRLFFYPNNPYFLDKQKYTQAILVPYGHTSTYNPTKRFKNGPSTMEDISDELEGYDGVTEFYSINSKNITEGLAFVLHNVQVQEFVPSSVILIGSSPEFIKNAFSTAEQLKNFYEVFTVSFNDQADFSSLSSGVGYSFTRRTEADEIGIAMAIASKLVEDQ